MVTAEDVDMMGIGVHCSHPECRQLDFLPFRCSCGGTFCLDHRLPSAHSCTSKVNEPQVIICPVCALAVKFTEGENPNVAFERHSRTECDPANYNRVHRKARCPVKGCREKLTTINAFTCKDCNVTVCLKHRLKDDHKCQGRAVSASAAANNRFTAWKSMFSSAGATSTTTTTAPTATNRTTTQQRRQPAKTAATTAATTLSTAKQKLNTAARTASQNIQSQLQQYRQQHTQGSGSGNEVCPQCNARFNTVQQLIEHASAAHSDGWSSGSAIGRTTTGAVGGGSGSGLESCPHCGQGFADPVQLVYHVERQCSHKKIGGEETCVLC